MAHPVIQERSVSLQWSGWMWWIAFLIGLICLALLVVGEGAW